MRPVDIADRVESLILELADNAEQRKLARIILRNRFAHPEIGATSPRQRGAAFASYRPPPPSIGSGQRTGSRCARCGWSARSHDIDGLRSDCDGYVAS